MQENCNDTTEWTTNWNNEGRSTYKSTTSDTYWSSNILMFCHYINGIMLDISEDSSMSHCTERHHLYWQCWKVPTEMMTNHIQLSSLWYNKQKQPSDIYGTPYKYRCVIIFIKPFHLQGIAKHVKGKAMMAVFGRIWVIEIAGRTWHTIY